jgi:hypothetical protein
MWQHGLSPRIVVGRLRAMLIQDHNIAGLDQHRGINSACARPAPALPCVLMTQRHRSLQ